MQQHNAGPGQGQLADRVIVNGRVTTFADAGTPPGATAVAFAGDRVLGVGDRAWADSVTGAGTVVHDVGGRRVLPGLVDSHTHLVRAGLTWTAEARWNGIASLGDALSTIATAAERAEPGRWVAVMGGWHPGQFAEGRPPTSADLDEAAGDVPAAVQLLYEYAVVNRAALDVLDPDAAIAEGTIPGSGIERDASGQPTGRIIGMPSLKWLYANIPKPDPETRVDSTAAASHELSRLGITGLIDGGGANMGPASYGSAVECAERGLLTVRLAATVHSTGPGTEEEQFRQILDGDAPRQVGDRFRVLGVGEVMLWTLHDAFTRYPTVDDEQARRLLTLLERFAEARWTMHMHVMRPETTRLLLDTIAAIHGRVAGLADLRWSIVHGYSLTPEDTELLLRAGVGIVGESQVRLAGDEITGRGGFPEQLVSPPLRGFAAAGVPVTLGSDAYRMSTYNPYETLDWFVTGRTVSGRQVQHPDLLLDVEECLDLMTRRAARFTFDEHERGQLAPGFKADVTVCSIDPLSVEPARLREISSMLTILDGDVTWAEPGFEGTSEQ